MLLCRTVFIWTLFLSSIILCQAATLSVGSGDSIQAAVATAKPGDVIEVGSGTYYEHIKVIQ